MEKVEYIKRSDTLAKIYYLHIDGEKAIREYDRYKHKDDFTETLQEVVFEIDSIPSADVAEVKHGEWEVLESFSDPLDDSHKDRCRCTNCGFIHVFTDFHYGQYNFCPECGARMDGE